MSFKTYSNKPDSHEVVQEVSCAICGSSSKRSAFSCDGAVFTRCTGCGILYQNPQPCGIAGRYGNDYFHYEQDAEDRFWQLTRMALTDIGFDSIDFPSSPEVVDIGCATGRFLYELLQKSWRVQGVEICEPSARFAAERGIPVSTSDLVGSGFESGRFDLVHASHVIEHVPDPAEFLDECVRILSPGGWLIITTPNTDSLQARLHGSQWRSLIPDHLYLFSRKLLVRELEKRELSVERVKTWGGLAAGSAPALAKRLLDILAKKFGFGDVVIVLARKSPS